MQRIAVIYGGFSSEVIISERSANTIVKHIPSEQFESIKVKIEEAGWFAEVDGKKLPIDKNDFSYTIEGIKFLFDKAFITIHGTPGEDGKLQGYFDLIGLPYINSGVTASALSFDKWMTNRFLAHAKIPSATAVLLKKDQEINPDDILYKTGLPCFVKPNDCGSSFGISKVKQKEDLLPAIELAFKEGKVVLVESFIKGTEVTCGAYLGAGGIKVLPPTEIVSEGEFFDFAAKYDGKSQEITPARIDVKTTQKVQELTEKIFFLMGLSGLARVDFIIENGIPHVIEVNTTPGMSEASIIPQQIKSIDGTLEEVFSEVLLLKN